jgi:transglutaminase-like putative cysteine protease
LKNTPLIIGVSLLFWGWQTGYLALAIFLALVVEISRWVPFRWDLSPKDFYRLSDISALLLMGMVAFRFIAGTESMARWLPIGLFPLLCGQYYSNAGGVDLGALLYVARKKEKARGFSDRQTVDVSSVYFACVIIATSAANHRTPMFYIGMSTLVGWALWQWRGRTRQWLFLLLFLSAAAMGFGASIGLNKLQIWLETDVIDWVTQQRQADRNPSRSMTAIGEIGKLKQDSAILFRVTPRGSFRANQLLHDASFNRYNNGLWVAGHTDFTTVPQPASEPAGTWNLSPPPPGKGFLSEITLKFSGEYGVLSLPLGCYQIQQLHTDKLERNQYGAFRIHTAPQYLTYRVLYNQTSRLQEGPSKNDLDIPLAEQPVIEAIVQSMDLKGRPPGQIVDRIRDFFQSRFSYSLEQGTPAKGSTPVSHFLQVSRSGHCEFYATATVLLLREAGIPARYATGYSVSEYSRLEKCFIVRSRHAHAWALAYVDDAWVSVDTTPASWVETEQEQSSMLTPAVDLFRWAGFHFSLWRRSSSSGGKYRWLAMILIPMLGLGVIRWVRKRKRSKPKESRERERVQASKQRINSPFPSLQDHLITSGYFKNRWETPGEWIDRLSETDLDPTVLSELKEIVRDHYRLRFHSKGLTNDEWHQMASRCQSVKKRFSASVQARQTPPVSSDG